MKEYPSYLYASVCLLFGLVLSISSLIPAIFPRSMETNVILYEHRQLFDDWTSQPFVDIVLENSVQGCPLDYEPLFHRAWNGTYDICLDSYNSNNDFNELQFNVL